jgi:RimJ/RimL family protein N-acetyltransferase
MEPYPELHTSRLALREFTAEDALDVQRLVGEWEVVRTLAVVPHPYEDGMAEEWIASLRPAYEAGKTLTWAVAQNDGPGELVGAITLHPNARDDNAELGYWIGRPYWGRGYATEAAREVVRYGFERLGLHRIHAEHLGSNPASGRVMQKIGMSYEATRPEHHKKWGVYEDRVATGCWLGLARSSSKIVCTSFPERRQHEVRSSPGPMGENFSGSWSVTSRHPLIHNGATNATW